MAINFIRVNLRTKHPTPDARLLSSRSFARPHRAFELEIDGIQDVLEILIVIVIIGCDSVREVYHKLVVILKGHLCLQVLGTKLMGLTRMKLIAMRDDER